MRTILSILFLLAIPVLLLAEEPIREWKSKSGKTIIEASFDASKDSNSEMVFLRKEGKLYKIPFNNLSKEDQEYVTKVRESRRSIDEDFGLEEVQEENASRKITVVPSRNRYALLIGVNEYAKPIPSLHYCVNDMKLLAEQFEKIGIPKENIILVTDDSPADRRPTGANIRRQIENVTQLVDEGGLLIVAFSGHGVMTKDGKSNLCPSDTNLTNQDSVVSREWVFDQLDNCKAKQKIFIIDACREEFSFESQRGLGGMRALEDPIGADSHGFILIASCDKKQYSHEFSELKHGAFTYYLVEGLSGAVKDEEGYVSIMNIFQYASSKTKRYVYDRFGVVQTPTFRLGNEMTDFYLTRIAVETESQSEPELDKTSNPLERILKQEELAKQRKIEQMQSSAAEFYANKDYDNAIQKLEEILKLDAESKEAKALLTRCKELKKQKQIAELQSSAAAFYTNKEYDKAIQKLEEILKLDSESKEAKALLTRCQSAFEELIRKELLQGLSAYGTRAGERKTVKVLSVEFAFRWCPAGTFMMGSPESEKGRHSCEERHQVTLTKGFWMMETEVTQKQWKAVMGNNPSSDIGDNLPVNKVSWNDCQDFCTKTGLQLPTEAQWEYACRAGSTGAYAGDLDEMAWYKENSNGDTHPVGTKTPNAWGLYDMYGNVEEWCQDKSTSTYGHDDYPSWSVTDPTGSSTGSYRIVRGGYWGNSSEYCRSAARWAETPNNRSSLYGFRCIKIPGN